MNLIEFKKKVASSPLPLVVDFWAPWCGPCKVMVPIFKDVAGKFSGRVDLLKVNVDESPEIARDLNIMSIPTTVGYQAGTIVYRKTGVQPPTSLESVFQNLSEGKTEFVVGLSPLTRILRLVAGGILIAFGAVRGPSWVLLLIGGVVAFTAVYDRCPIYRAVKGKISAMFAKKGGSSA